MAEGRNVVIVTGRGTDGPGLAHAFIKTVDDHGCRVLDIAQFLLEGQLVFTFVLDVGAQGSITLFKDLLDFGASCGMKMDFHFPQANAADSVSEVDGNVAVVSVVTPKPISLGLVEAVDSVLKAHGCVVREIDHRSDNKAENNGEFNKVQLIVSCPRGLELSTLYMGAPSGEAAGAFWKVGEDHGAKVTIRWWDALNRLNGKSLVVFELSNVIYPCQVLDELLKEAGLDPSADSKSENALDEIRRRTSLLKGQSVEVVDKLIKRLEFSPGARLVCRTLKAMGARLAVLSEASGARLVEHLKQQLGIDYVMCRDLEVTPDGKFTGEFAGEVTDVRFRKADLLKLMAEREGIDTKNVVTVGEFLQGLKRSSARHMLETFGPNLHVNTSQGADLTSILYLLGFNGSHVRGLRQQTESTLAMSGSFVGIPKGSFESDPDVSRVLVQIGARDRRPGHLSQIFSPLLTLPCLKGVSVATVRQCGLEDGGMCLGLELRVPQGSSDQVAKEVLFACQKEGCHVELGIASDNSPPCWQQYYHNRYVVTMVRKAGIQGSSLMKMFDLWGKNGANIVSMQRLSKKDIAAFQMTVNLPDELAESEVQEQLRKVSTECGVDVAIQRDDPDRWMRRLIVFDMDSTLIQQEVIDELGKYAGVETKMKEMTEAAMRGELNFFESLKARVALLKGQPAEELFDRVKKNLIFTPGAKKLCGTLKRLGYKMAVISGGFLPVAMEVKNHLELDYAFANTLEVDEETGLLTGRTTGPVVTPQRKRALLATIANVEGCRVSQTIAVGDGANDIPMLNSAGLGIAFCAKPKVQAATEFRINEQDLSTVLFLIGLSEDAAERLAPNPTAADAAREMVGVAG